jgi:hypothetical protein
MSTAGCPRPGVGHWGFRCGALVRKSLAAARRERADARLPAVAPVADWSGPSGPGLRGLGLLPYRNPAEVALVLQDIDVMTESTESTSILTDAAMIGEKKTQAVAAWPARLCDISAGANVRRRLQAPGG